MSTVKSAVFNQNSFQLIVSDCLVQADNSNMKDSGVPEHIIAAFHSYDTAHGGFPKAWKKILSQTTKPPTAQPSVSPSVSTPKSAFPNTPTTPGNTTDFSIPTFYYSLIFCVCTCACSTSVATCVLLLTALDPLLVSPPVSTKVPSRKAPVASKATTPMASKTTPAAGNPTKGPDNATPVQPSPQTRSGRSVRKPLEYWRGQVAMHNFLF